MIRAMLRRWRGRRSLPTIMRNGTPRDGGRGTLDLSAMPVECGGLEQASVDASRLASFGPSRPDLVAPLEWRAMQAQQRHETQEDRVRSAMAQQARRNEW